jgi:predicted O-linked N-acetylglucosamine transferase (SPINDLY family)
MPDSIFVSAVERITAGALGLSEAISAAHELTAAGRSDLSIQLYRIWTKFNADHPLVHTIHFNRAVLHSDRGELDAAELALREAIALNPDFSPAYVNLGGVLERKGAIGDAVLAWNVGAERLAAVTGQSFKYKAMTLKQMARVLLDHHQADAAESTLQRCLELDPTQRDAASQYSALRLSRCRWPVAAQDVLARAEFVRGIQPLTMAAYTDDPLLQLGSAWLYIKDDIPPVPARLSTDRRHAPIDLSGRRLRIGYVSSDLRDHAIGYLMAELFELHDREAVEVFAYYCGIPDDGSPLTQRIKAAVEHWVDIRGLDDNAAAARIGADGIDILVDVNGMTKFARTGVFARRAAPVQVNWLGFPGSMASPYHQYIIADDYIIPPSHEIYYSEKVLRLDCYQSNDRRRIVADTRPSRAEAGLPEEGFVFCCFNGAQKFTRFTFERWMAILKQVPGSVLWLLSGGAETDERLRDYAEQLGVARERIVIAPKLANAHHMARYPLADLFLDTTPYGAHTTASDALWMGVPVLTVPGRSFASRVCGSLVSAAGLPELVCDTPEAFVERAVALAQDPARLKGYRDRLEQGRNSCVLFDMDRLTRRLEDLYRHMAAEHQAGRTPQPDLRNLDEYLEAGVQFDPDQEEMLAAPDYHGLYREKLRLRHLARPIAPDARLWTEAEIAEADRAPIAGPGAVPAANAA